MSGIVTMTLYGGPHDGENIEIHSGNLNIKPRISMEDDQGVISEYALDNDGKFVWLPDPNDPKVARGFFVCDDDGNVISEETTVEGVLKRLDELNSDD